MSTSAARIEIAASAVSSVACAARAADCARSSEAWESVAGRGQPFGAFEVRLREVVVRDCLVEIGPRHPQRRLRGGHRGAGLLARAHVEGRRIEWAASGATTVVPRSTTSPGSTSTRKQAAGNRRRDDIGVVHPRARLLVDRDHHRAPAVTSPISTSTGCGRNAQIEPRAEQGPAARKGDEPDGISCVCAILVLTHSRVFNAETSSIRSRSCFTSQPEKHRRNQNRDQRRACDGMRASKINGIE